jgi:hypothetical protein
VRLDGTRGEGTRKEWVVSSGLKEQEDLFASMLPFAFRVLCFERYKKILIFERFDCLILLGKSLV